MLGIFRQYLIVWYITCLENSPSCYPLWSTLLNWVTKFRTSNSLCPSYQPIRSDMIQSAVHKDFHSPYVNKIYSSRICTCSTLYKTLHYRCKIISVHPVGQPQFLKFCICLRGVLYYGEQAKFTFLIFYQRTFSLFFVLLQNEKCSPF